MKAPFTEAGLKKRLASITRVRKRFEKKNVDNLHVRIQKGNRKTGHNCFTVSLIPVIDCQNCSLCKHNCYDLKSDLIYDKTVADRCRNSVIHANDPKRYWNEIDMQVKANYVEYLRVNVGGDLTDEDFGYVAKLGRQNKRTHILFFTKNFKGINKFLELHRFPKNVHPIMSAWEGLTMDNPYHLPESHLLYSDGRTTAPSFGAYYCGNDCTACAFNEEGCWVLKKNEHVIFNAH